MKTDEWIPYPRRRKMLAKKDHVIIVPEDYDEASKGMSLFCDVCQIRYRSKEDEKTYEKFGCCVPCADTWAYSNSEEWLRGWRPSSEAIEGSVKKRSIAGSDILFE